jgi:hypothetical protein
MRKFAVKSRARLFRTGLRVMGLCSLAFMIEACYGTPQADYEHIPARDLDVTGKVSGSDGQPEAGVNVRLNAGSRDYFSITGSDGRYHFSGVSPDAPVLILTATNPGGHSSAIEIAAPQRPAPGETLVKDMIVNN